jgi:hypothetical protein
MFSISSQDAPALGLASPDLEVSLLQRWLPVPLLPKSKLRQRESFSETDLREISEVL